MPVYRPHTRLATHEVSNQPSPFEDVNIFERDRALSDAVTHAGGDVHRSALTEFGARCGSVEVFEWARLANDNLPKLRAFDRYGHRIDEVEYHPAYHRLMELGIAAGVSAGAWTAAESGHTLHAVLMYLMYQVDGGVCCPMSMTYASMPLIRKEPEIARDWVARVTSGRYDPSSLPATEKRGATIGMAMTEKQGGSDVRTNTTAAAPVGDDAYELTGHKWFCSAPMSDAFFTLAQTADGLTCFLVPRWRPDGTRNGIHIMRLKDKLGDRSNASSEIDYDRAYALRVGEEGRGIATIIEMVNLTRFDCILGSAGAMRMALTQALWHTSQRIAFGKKLIDQPAMSAVLADLAIESEAAVALALRIARAFDRSDDAAEAAYSRLATAIAKYWVCKRLPGFANEALECHGGAGFVEESPMPRLYRQAPLNAIWEGSSNVIVLDALRAISRAPDGIEAVRAEIRKARGANRLLDRHLGRVDAWFEPDALNEAQARAFAEDLALALQAAALRAVAPNYVFDAFCSARLDVDRRSLAYGASTAAVDRSRIIERAML